ncbi:MAG: hypothetical protein ACC642_04165, partial [Pseudomonadales bacterium]
MALFGISGATGLLYESIWTQYLGLFLGHSAYAQSLVLMLFMGGLSLGAYMAGRHTRRLEDPLKVYALIEALIGISALAFHSLYLGSTNFFFDQWLSLINGPTAIALSQWLLAALLVFPQTLLLGATFPLMVAGLDRRSDRSTGHSTAGVYFINSLGAALGVLLTGFYLAPEFGLPASMTMAGVTNLLIAAVAFLLSGASTTSAPAVERSDRGNPLLFLVVAGVTGCASFIYEIGWIRMLSLVLGSSSHAFELMLSAFIGGLAIGGYVIRRRIENLANPRRTLAIVQLAMGALAALSVAFYDQTFIAMQFFIQALDQTEQGYFLFNILCHSLTFVFMLPVTICAGMTLPLLTQSMVDEGHGEASIGKVYSANTLGSLLGVMLALHLFMPVFGLKALICIGALADISLGWWLITRAPGLSRRSLACAALAGVVWLGVVGFVHLDPVKMASGVYLRGDIRTSREILFHQDGKTASVDVFRNGSDLAIATNGKVDAAVNDIRPTKDEPTMTLLAILPYSIKPEARSAAVIGFGSGITSHTLLASEYLETVDTIEIEPAMVTGARYFGSRVSRVFEDPRSRIVIDDAKTFLANGKRHYDLIISEPSNPWISGIASLFSVEHYRVMQRHLTEGGLFVQWLQIYGMTPETVASVMKALQASFPHYALYALNNTDLAIVAAHSTEVTLPGDFPFANREMKHALDVIGIHNVADFHHRRIGSNKLLSPYFQSFSVAANSDYHGVLAPAAVKARYLGDDALELQRFRLVPAPLSKLIDGVQWPVDPERLSENLHLHSADLARNALRIRRWILGGERSATIDVGVRGALLAVTAPWCSEQTPESLVGSLQTIAEQTLPYLLTADNEAIWNKLAQRDCVHAEADDWIESVRLISVGDYGLAVDVISASVFLLTK